MDPRNRSKPVKLAPRLEEVLVRDACPIGSRVVPNPWEPLTDAEGALLMLALPMIG